jgi:hypothetical protein
MIFIASCVPSLESGGFSKPSFGSSLHAVTITTNSTSDFNRCIMLHSSVRE